MWNGDDGKGWGKAMRRWGWGQWRCPSEGHGRECGLRPSVQSGVPRCGALSLSLLPSLLLLSISISFSLFPLSLSLLLAHSLTHTLPSLSCLLRYRATPCSSSSVCAFVAISLLVSLSFFGPAAWCGAGRLGRLQECTKCTVLTDARPCSTASTCLLRPFSFASLSVLSLAPLPALSLSLARSVYLSRSPRGSSLLFSSIDYSASAGHSLTSFTSLRRRRRCHSREQSSASLPPCDASSSPRLFLAVGSTYVRAYRTHAHVHT